MMGYYYNMMGTGISGITTLLVWILLILGIAALWKFLTKK